MRTSLAVVLAAGEGKRVKSSLPKVLHRVGGLPLIGHVATTLKESGVDRAAVVIAPGHEAVRAAVAEILPEAMFFTQAEPRGTAHAVHAARQALEQGADDVLVLYGDTPFVTSAGLERLRQALAAGAAIAVGGVHLEDPAGYGRLILEGGELVAIREERDASDAERALSFCNGGIMGLSGSAILDLLDAIDDRNDQGEFYLTDAVALARGRGLRVAAVEFSAAELLGVNDRIQLAEAERLFQESRRAAAMAAGATLIAPETVFFSHDTKIGRDVTIEPNVWLGPGVTIADGVIVRGFCHIEGASIETGAIVGPFARLRPGALIGRHVHIGDFVEIKAASIDEGAKINHLAYVGDAHVGAGANIGAGTIVCNFDGVAKHRTEIGARAFVGSNTALVAPVTVGDGAYIATGSVITEDVAPDALAIARERQVAKPGWAAERRKKR